LQVRLPSKYPHLDDRKPGALSLKNASTEGHHHNENLHGAHKGDNFGLKFSECEGICRWVKQVGSEGVSENSYHL